MSTKRSQKLKFTYLNLHTYLSMCDLLVARKPKVPGSSPAATYVQRWKW